MVAYICVSIISGLLLGTLDAVIHGNALARRLSEVYQPLARDSVNVAAGVAIDLAYGFALAGIFLLLYPSLPGTSGLQKGISFAVGLWFLRVFMNVASSWIMFRVPPAWLLYTLVTGLVELLVLGLLYGLTLARGD